MGQNGARGGLALLGAAAEMPPRVSVLPAQRLYGRPGDVLVVHGKEKVYGSIP